MERRGVGDTGRALLASSHPVPGITVTVVGTALAVSVGSSLAHVALVVAALALNQLSIGWSNDWLDAGRDRAVGRTDKPVATGAIAVSTVRTAAVVGAALSLLLGAAISPVTGLANAVLLASGWAYNALLKRTAISPLPYLTGFGALPWIATGAVGSAALGWATAAGALFGLGAHLANVLPDLEADARTGVRGLPHRFPPGVVAAVAGGAVVAGAILVATGLGGAAGVAAVALTAVPAVLAIRSGRAAASSPRRAAWAFRWIMAGALALAAALVAAGPRLLA